MKRFAVLVLAVLCLPMVGCRAGREADRRFMISALGFDLSGSELNVSAETLVVNSESTDEEISTEMFTASGKDAEECIFNLTRGMSKDLQLAHCGVIAVGSSVTGDALDGVIKYCQKNREINLSAYLVAAENAETLLSGKALSALTVGYELMGFLEHYSDETGIMYGCRIYEVQSARRKQTPVYILPVFSAKESGFALVSAALYIGNRYIMPMSPEEMAVYSLVKGNNRGGKIHADGNVYNVRSPHTYFKCSEKGGTTDVKLGVTFSPDGADAALCNYIIRSAEMLLKRSGGEDVFGICDRIYAENADLWQKIKDGAVGIKDAHVGISCEMRRTDYAK